MMDAAQMKALREPFPKSVIGKLPKGGTMLDYVGHAAVTDRLLAVDPDWSWEPFATTPEGLPALDRSGNLWIKLTVAGVTRIGVGDGKSAKEVIGDAIRNAAMRFGVALDLWAKEDLAAMHDDAPPAEPAPAAPRQERPAAKPSEISPAQLGKLNAQLTAYGKTERNAKLNFLSDALGRQIDSSKDLTKAEASLVIDELTELLTQRKKWDEQKAITAGTPPPPDEPAMFDEPPGWEGDRG